MLNKVFENKCFFNLVTAFRDVSSHHTLEQHGNLPRLLVRVDERRQQRFEEQREKDEDEDYRVSGKPELTGLADMLKEIKQGVI